MAFKCLTNALPKFMLNSAHKNWKSLPLRSHVHEVWPKRFSVHLVFIKDLWFIWSSLASQMQGVNSVSLRAAVLEVNRCLRGRMLRKLFWKSLNRNITFSPFWISPLSCIPSELSCIHANICTDQLFSHNEMFLLRALFVNPVYI